MSLRLAGPILAADAKPLGDGETTWLRDGLFLVAFLLLWLSFAPFADLGSADSLDPVGGGLVLNQAATVLLTVALAAFLYRSGSGTVLRAAASPVLIAVLGWFAISAALSLNSGLALRRLVLAVLTIFQACAFLVLPRDLRHFARLLSIGALLVLFVCYAGVLFLPHLSIHQSTDLREPELAGDWRGAFGHKNGAGGEMVMFIFFGLFAARIWSVLAGWSIVALAAVFLFFTHSKSPTGLLPFVLLFSYAVLHVRGLWAKAAVILCLPASLALVTIGSVSVPAIRALLGAVTSDPSFTGRDVIWIFALDNTLAKPLFGHGFQAFWGTSELLYNWNPFESWGMRATDAHNGFLNLSVMTGFGGLGLALMWIVAQPIADLVRAQQRQGDRDLTLLLIRIWLFGLCLSSFESVLFAGGSTLWFMMVVSIIGLRLQTVARVVQ